MAVYISTQLYKRACYISIHMHACITIRSPSCS